MQTFSIMTNNTAIQKKDRYYFIPLLNIYVYIHYYKFILNL